MIIYRIWLTTIKLTFFLFSIKESFDLISSDLKLIVLFIFIFDMIISINTGFYS